MYLGSLGCHLSWQAQYFGEEDWPLTFLLLTLESTTHETRNTKENTTMQAVALSLPSFNAIFCQQSNARQSTSTTNQPTNQPNKHNKPTTKQRQSLSSVHRVWRSQIAQQNDVLQLNGTIPAMAKARGLTMPSGNGGGLPDQIPELLSSS